jgi:HD-GYP domain-containing protein (c-di-GMP phosphodiesterase class II)
METTVRTLTHRLPGAPPSQASHSERFIPILAEGLRVDTIVNFDLYLKSDGGKKFVLYRNKDLPFTNENAERLKSQGVGQLHIDATDRGKYLTYVEKNLPSILVDNDIEMTKKSILLYDSAANMVDQVFNRPTAPENLSRTSTMVSHMCGFVIGDRAAFKNLFSIASHDYYTYTHSVNVCTYSIAVADAMGLRDADEMHELGVGALLHDIGKSRISEKIICKPGPLSTPEWEELKQHPFYGWELLSKAGGISHNSISVVLSHHEKINGSGYPSGLRGDEIPKYARIACIADIFDALTTIRPYKGAMNSFDALMLMGRDMEGELDENTYEHFVLLLEE